MERQAKSSASAVLLGIAALLIAVLSASYMAGYFVLCERIEAGRFRVYEARWLATIYRPAAWVEYIVTGTEVETAYSSPTYPGE